MKNLRLIINPEVELLFNNYPIQVHDKLQKLRKLILDTADDIEEIESVEETLKWGEPSYIVKNGSTIRIDWKKREPEQYAMYFKCTSKLITTFKMVYGDLFQYEGNRALIFQLNYEIPEAALKGCIAAALTYHKVKQLPLLGL